MWKTSGLALGLLRASAHPTCLARAPRLEDFGLAIGLLRASAHPTCLARAPRLEDFGLAIGLLRASGHFSSLECGRLRFGDWAPSRKRSSDLPRACPSTGKLRFGDWA